MHKGPGIGRKSILYELMKRYIDICFRHYYKVSYKGKDRVKTVGNFIFAPNHQNALMDALAVLTSFTWQPVFLARSDIFAKKTVARILTFFKILPVYRIRDGFDQVSNNRETFNKVFAVMESNIPITIMPEGNHDDRKLLRPMKKGIARLAFSFRHETGTNNNVQIVPVGLHYFDHHKPRSPLFIWYGEPISISAFDNEYLDNPPKAVNRFLKELHLRLSALIIHIAKGDIYPICDKLTTLYEALSIARREKTETSFFMQQQIVETLEIMQQKDSITINQLADSIAELEKLLHSQNASIKSLQYLTYGKNTSFLLYSLRSALVFSFPIYIYAWVNTFLPYLLLIYIRKRIKDPQFISSVTFVAYYLLYPVIHVLQALLLGLITGSALLALAYLITLPVSFLFRLWWKETKNFIYSNHRLEKIKTEVLSKISSISNLTNVKFT